MSTTPTPTLSTPNHLKEEGISAFKAKNYHLAIKHFTQILSSNPTHAYSLEMRSICYYKTFETKLCLKDANSLLLLKPNNENGIMNKIHCLWKLEKFEEALEFLKSMKIPENPTHLEIYKTVYNQTLNYLKQSKGKYKIMDILKLPDDQRHSIPEYTQGYKIISIPGKGQSVIATSDILPGQLISLTRAFCIVFDFELQETSWDSHNKIDFLVRKCYEKLCSCSESRTEFSKLFLSDETHTNNYNNESEIRFDSKKPQEMFTNLQVSKRVEENCFFGGGGIGSSPQFCGLWFLSSHINRSCIDANTHWDIKGNLLMLRAFKPIKKGQELTISEFYSIKNDPYKRPQVISNSTRRRFCQCRLCSFQKSEDQEITKSITRSLDEIRSELKISPDLNKIMSKVKQIVDLRGEENIEFNLALLNPIFDIVGRLLFASERFEEAAEVFKFIRRAKNNTIYLKDLVEKDIQIGKCYLRLGDEAEVDYWLGVFKHDFWVCGGGLVKKGSVLGTEFIKEVSEFKKRGGVCYPGV